MRNEKIIYAAAVCCLNFFIIAPALGQDGVGNRPPASKSITVDPFTQFSNSGPDDVTIVQGDAFSMKVTGLKDDIDSLSIKSQGGLLTISRQHERRQQSGVFITLIAPSLQSVDMKGDGRTRIKFTTLKSLSARLRSTGSLVIEGGNLSSAAIVSSGSGNLDLLNVNVGNLQIDLRGSGCVTAAGRARRSDFTSSGSGSIDASKLRSVSGRFDVSGSGGLVAFSTSPPVVRVSGSGSVDITGSSGCDLVNTGSGQVRCGEGR